MTTYDNRPFGYVVEDCPRWPSILLNLDQLNESKGILDRKVHTAGRLLFGRAKRVGLQRGQRVRETLIFKDLLDFFLMRRVQRQSKTSQGNSCRFVDLGRPKRWFLGRQRNFRAFSKADALEGNKDIHVDATSWSTEKLILNFKDHVTYGFAKTICEAIAHVTDKTSQDSVGDVVGWNFWSGNSHFGRVFLQESVQTLSPLKV